MYNEIISDKTNTSKIGNFTSLSVGAGSTVLKATGNYLWAGSSNPSSAPFKVNRQTGALTATGATITGAITATSGSFTGAINATSGSFTGSINATSGTFRGTIYAEDGAIEGDLLVSGDLTMTGSLFSDDGTGFQFKLANGKVSFLKSSVEKGYIRTPSGSNGLQISTGENLYLTKISGTPILTIGQDGAIILNGQSGYYAWSTGRSMVADGNNINFNGHLLPHSDYGDNLGSATKRWDYIDGHYLRASDKFVCRGSEGQTQSGYGLIRQIRADDGRLEAKYTEFTFVGGILTNINEKSSWYDQGSY